MTYQKVIQNIHEIHKISIKEHSQETNRTIRIKIKIEIEIFPKAEV